MSADEDMNASVQKQLLQLSQIMETHLKSTLSPSMSKAIEFKNIKAPEGRHDMTASEFRTYTKDCQDYKSLTNCEDKQLVIQMRLNMDSEMKRSIDTNFGESWNQFSLVKALSSIKTLLKCNSNPAIFRKEFDKMFQQTGESIREYITRLKICALDCDFCCPFDPEHDLTEYHIINKLRCGVFDTQLQQELLQKSNELNTIELMTSYCENFECAKNDCDRLRDDNHSICSNDLTNKEVIAAISSYKKSKNTKSKCGRCGFEKHELAKCPAQGKKCTKCNKLNHFATNCRSRVNDIKEAASVDGASAVVISTILANVSKVPNVGVSVRFNGSTTELVGIADTGAQVCVAGEQLMNLLKLSKADIEIPDEKLKHVGGELLDVIGCIKVTIALKEYFVETVVYLVKGVPELYLSLDVCKGLHLVGKEFPNETITYPSSLSNVNMFHKRIKPDKIPFKPIEKIYHC